MGFRTKIYIGIRRQICLRDLVCNDVTTDLMIGLPSTKFFDLLPILREHLDSIVCCEICSVVEINNTKNNKLTHGEKADGATGK